MSLKIKKCCLITVVLLLIGCAEEKTTVAGKWYTPQQLSVGKQVFRENCVACHGSRGEGSASWRQRQADGSYPPPPLNGTAHTWHHPLNALRRTIEKGGVAVGGQMPPFGGKLSDDEVVAVIAFFQSQWNDEIYQAWVERGGLQ